MIHLTQVLNTRASLFINTGASARCKRVLWNAQLFQQFVPQRGKPLKRLLALWVSLHRAKAPVLMGAGGLPCAESKLAGLPAFACNLHPAIA